MTLVTISGTFTDGGGVAIPAGQEPRLFAVPDRPYVGPSGVMTDDEVPCVIAEDGKSFSVQVDNTPGVLWTLQHDRLVPGQELESPGKRARDFVQWSQPFWPGQGGDIAALGPWTWMQGVVAGFGPVTEWPWPVLYLNLSEPSGKLGLYTPEGILATEGGA